MFSVGKNKNGSTRQWVHPPETLLRGHIVYNVKFLGHCEVEKPKGTDVVRDAIRKMKFNKQIRRAEGQKPPKVELAISVDGVTVQEPKLKIIQHQYSLHRISYCADDKSDKRMFTFIAKESDTNVHHCYVFDSDKCAEEITLTIGQAFELAYKKYLDSSGAPDLKMHKQFLMVQKKVQQLTQENIQLKERVADLERLIDPTILDNFDKQRQATASSPTQSDNPVVGRKLENLILDDDRSPAPQTNGRTTPPLAVPALAPPPPIPSRSNPPTSFPTPVLQGADAQASGDLDLFGAKPFTPTTPTGKVTQATPTTPSNPFTPPPRAVGRAVPGPDPFGMPQFTPSSPQELEKQIQHVDNLLDLQAGFSRGLSFGTEDFSLDDLDPLNNRK